jgi:hypothetical protein
MVPERPLSAVMFGQGTHSHHHNSKFIRVWSTGAHGALSGDVWIGAGDECVRGEQGTAWVCGGEQGECARLVSTITLLIQRSINMLAGARLFDCSMLCDGRNCSWSLGPFC